MLGRRSVVKDLNPGLDLNKRSSRKRKRNLEDEGLERETQRVNRGESTSDQEEAGPSNSEQVEAGPSSSEQVEASPANIGQGLTGPPNIGQGPAGPANIGQGLTGPPNTGQGLAGPAGQGITGVAQAGVRLWDRWLGRPTGARYGPLQPVPGIWTPPLSMPRMDEPWVGKSILGTSTRLPEHPGPVETPSLVNTPGSTPTGDNIPEGESVPPGDSASGMDLF